MHLHLIGKSYMQYRLWPLGVAIAGPGPEDFSSALFWLLGAVTSIEDNRMVVGGGMSLGAGVLAENLHVDDMN